MRYPIHFTENVEYGAFGSGPPDIVAACGKTLTGYDLETGRAKRTTNRNGFITCRKCLKALEMRV